MDQKEVSDSPTTELKPDEALEPESPEEKKFRWKFVIILVVILILVITLYILFGQDAVHWLYSRLQTVVKENPFWSSILLVLLQAPFASIPFMPGLAYLHVMVAMIWKNIAIAWSISFFGGLFWSCIIYLLVRKFFLESVRSRFHHYEPYQLLLEETREHPLRDGILFEFMMIPVSLKNYIIAVSELEFWQAVIVFIPGPTLHCLLSTLIGVELTNISDIFSSKGFSERSTLEKAEFFGSIVFIVLTVILFVVIAIYYKRKYDAFIERKRKAEIENTEVKDMI